MYAVIHSPMLSMVPACPWLSKPGQAQPLTTMGISLPPAHTPHLLPESLPSMALPLTSYLGPCPR